MKKIFTLNLLIVLLGITSGLVAQTPPGKGKDKLPKEAVLQARTQEQTYKLFCIDTNSSVQTVNVCADSFIWNGITYTSPGTYTRKYTNVQGCDSTACLILTLKRDLVIAVDQKTLSAIEDFESYQWFKNRKPIAGANERFYTLVPPYPGHYSLVVNALSCPDTSADYIIEDEGAYIWGLVYKRNDANCVFDGDIDETLARAFTFRLDKNNVPQDTLISGASTFGIRIDNLDKKAEYSLHWIPVPGYKAVCPSNGIQKFRPDTLSEKWAMEFALDCDKDSPQPDLHVHMDGLLRPVSQSYLSLFAGMASCGPQDATLTLELSPKFAFNNASVTPSAVNGQTITWELKGWTGSVSESIDLSLDPVGNLQQGDTACNTVRITPLAGDREPTNNVYTACSEIRSSWDPNDKKVSPVGDIAPGTELTYTINFENLGNDTAFNIYILDTLSHNLVYSTFELMYSSHPVKIRFSDVVDPRVARFDFENIYLADKSSPDHNKGSLIYKIKAKDQLPAGATIENTAHIFFDINPAVVTNTTLNAIGGTAIKTMATAKPAPRMFPNPLTDKLHIDNPSAQLNQLTIVNILGQTLYQGTMGTGITVLSTTFLLPGIYYIRFGGAYETQPAKLIRK